MTESATGVKRSKKLTFIVLAAALSTLGANQCGMTEIRSRFERPRIPSDDLARSPSGSESHLEGTPPTSTQYDSSALIARAAPERPKRVEFLSHHKKRESPDRVLATVVTGCELLTFDLARTGDVPPTRGIGDLSGKQFGEEGPQGLALSDSKIFVPGLKQVWVYSCGDQGQVAPERTLEGPATQLAGITAIVVDQVHHELVVGVYGAVLVFRDNASGNAAPLRRLVLRGHEHEMARTVVVNERNDTLLVQLGNEARTYPRAAEGSRFEPSGS
jgi:hypothetical protein